MRQHIHVLAQVAMLIHHTVPGIARTALSTPQIAIYALIQVLTDTATHTDDPHDFIITRDIATDIGLKVVPANPEEEDLMMKLFSSYESEFKMHVPFDAEEFFMRQSSQKVPRQPPPQQPPTQLSMPQAAIQVPQTAFSTDSHSIAISGLRTPDSEAL